MAHASIGRRAVAAIIDGLVLFLIAYLMAIPTGGVRETSFEVTGAPAMLAFALWIAYYVVTEATLGASPGKRLIGLRVVRSDGSPIGWPAAVVRNVLRIVDGLVFYILGAILIVRSSKGQRLGDRVADTVVVTAASRA